MLPHIVKLALSGETNLGQDALQLFLGFVGLENTNDAYWSLLSTGFLEIGGAEERDFVFLRFTCLGMFLSLFRC